MLADGSFPILSSIANALLPSGSVDLALDRVEAASIRFPALEDVSVDLIGALSDRKGFTYASRAPILAKLCTCTFVTKLDLDDNDIAVVPDAIGALTNLKELNLDGNKIATLPASIGRLTALETLNLDSNILTAVPSSIGSLPQQQPHRDAPRLHRQDDGLEDALARAEQAHIYAS